MFGGEGVLVKMATAATEPIRIRTKVRYECHMYDTFVCFLATVDTE